MDDEPEADHHATCYELEDSKDLNNHHSIEWEANGIGRIEVNILDEVYISLNDAGLCLGNRPFIIEENDHINNNGKQRSHLIQLL